MTEDRLIIAWAAGIFEGEGCITIIENRVRVVVEMTDLDILERLQQHFGGSLSKQVKRKAHWKDSWKWRLTGSASSKEFLKLIYPILGTRRRTRCDQAFATVSNIKAVKKSELVLRVYQLRDSGLTHQAISDIIGCDRSYVSHILRKRNC